MTANQLYSLTWGDFGTSLVSAVQLLRCHGDLVDVTLAAGGRCFPAHKIVLCAASPFLLDLLKSTPCKHPVVMLAGVTATDLEALLEFVYRGEVSIDPNQLPSLLQAAHCLNIQGLAPATTNETHNQNTLHHTIKAVIDIAKTEDINQAPTGNHEALSRDVINSFLPLRRRKRIKRKTSTSPRNKWHRPDIEDNTENRPVEQQSVTVNEHGEVLSMTEVHPRKTVQGASQTEEVWTDQDLNFTNVQTTATITSPDQLIVSTGHLPHIAAPQVTTPSTPTSTSVTKTRSASDQPGTCPLCGAMLRQARNLRRHLLTSCKYRDSGEQLQTTPTTTPTEHRVQHTREPDLHQLQPVAMQTVERVAPSSAAHLENKTSVLTHITCGNMIVTDCSINNSMK